MITIQIFEKRSVEKKRNAMFMLSIAIAVIVIGMFIFMNQLADVAKSLDDSTTKLANSKDLNAVDKESLVQSIQVTQIINMITRIVFIIIVFFIAQVFLKLYRHNMNLSDFYFSCVDAWKLNEEVEHPKKKENYMLLLKALYPNEIKLDIPNSPDIANVLNILKKE